MWVLDLFTLFWTQITDIPLLQQTGYIFLLYSGIAYHSSERFVNLHLWRDNKKPKQQTVLPDRDPKIQAAVSQKSKP